MVVIQYSLSLLLFILSTVRVHGEYCEEWPTPVKDDHPCVRTCVKGESKTCYYRFSVEHYFTLGKACYNCPTNISDCYRKDCVQMDGYEKVLYTVNRQIPGPTIEVCLGDKIVVILENLMHDETTSIHWHGMLQEGTQYMDGVPYVTQCPIQPGSTFKYEFWATEYGTHFWHGHTGIQRVDGLFGAIIVKQPKDEEIHKDLFEIDTHILVMNDWSHSGGMKKQMSIFHNTGTNAGDTVLCNGRGRYYNGSEQVTNTPVEVFTVEQGCKYRFRVVGAGAYDCPIALYIDNHTLLAIAGDGSEFEPVPVDSIVTLAGERWDFVLHANQTIDNYWIRLTGKMSCSSNEAHTVAILHYKGAPCGDPTAAVGYNVHPTPVMELNTLNVARNTSGCVSLPTLSAPFNRSEDDIEVLKEKPDKRIVLYYDFNPTDNKWFHKKGLYGFYQLNSTMRTYTPQFNHISYKATHSPLLSQPCDIDPRTYCNNETLTNCTEEYCECTMIHAVELGHIVELILIDHGVTYNASHPFHLHGHAFRVVGMDRLGDSTTLEYVKELDEGGDIPRNLKDAPYKDTVCVPDGGYTIVRFKARNPGYWLFHCHLEIHYELHMAVVFKVGDEKDFPPVPEGFPKCGDFGFKKRKCPNKPQIYYTPNTSLKTLFSRGTVIRRSTTDNP